MPKKTAEELHPILLRFANGKGITLNPEKEFALDLIRGFLHNEERVGYRCCPCRLPVGDKDWDRDIICPCVYMMPDVKDFGQCFCALYVSNEFAERIKLGGKDIHDSIPERRPLSKLDYPG